MKLYIVEPDRLLDDIMLEKAFDAITLEKVEELRSVGTTREGDAKVGWKLSTQSFGQIMLRKLAEKDLEANKTGGRRAATPIATGR